MVEQSTPLPSDELRGAKACQVALGWLQEGGFLLHRCSTSTAVVSPCRCLHFLRPAVFLPSLLWVSHGLQSPRLSLLREPAGHSGVNKLGNHM